MKSTWSSVFVVLVVVAIVVDAQPREERTKKRDSCGIGSNKREELKKLQTIVEAKINTTCLLCEIAVTGTRDYIDANNLTHTDIEKIIDFFCVALKIEDKYICSNIVTEFEGLFFYLISDKSITAEFACGVLGVCPAAVFPGWNITLTPTPPATPYPPPNPKNPSIYVLHVTDIHIDPLYTPGLLSTCDEPICCRPPLPAGEPAAGKFGAYNCDLPPVLYENMLAWIGKNLPNISYAIFTGDVPAHDVWAENRTSALDKDTYVFDTFQTYLPNVPLFPAVGNHESVPVNEFAPRSVSGQWNMSWLYDGLAERWEFWLPTAVLAEVTFAGYYTAKTADGVRIISMNTNLGCNNENWFLSFPSSESADPDGQLQWLANILEAAETANEIVYLIKHIAPSNGDCGADWWRNYFRIVDRYKNIILGDFAGHTHDDIFAVTYALENSTTVRPVITTYFPGSVTPYSDENPGFRIYEVDSVTKGIIDYVEYAINLTLANEQGFPTWAPIYSARSAYSLPDMSPSSWHDASLQMGQNETLLYEYWSRNGKLSFASTCNSGCLHDVWCNLWNPPPDTNVSICGL